MCSKTTVPALATYGKKVIDMYQSWGISVGDQGIQHFDESFINSGCIMDVFTFVKHTFDQDLKFGMVNDEVKYLQVKLGMPSNTLGFGIFGPKTLATVKAYQAANNIFPISGYVGPLTRAKLNS
jgi:peptidoglycan hydrolase-like protein with peptidoglycan-binding domain